MADRVIKWHVKGILSETEVVDSDVHGDAHYADKDYIPIDAHLRVKTACDGTQGKGIKVDINDDGTSIFATGHEPVLPPGTGVVHCNNFAGPQPLILEGSWLTLDIDVVGDKYAGKDLVVILELDEA